MKKKELIDFINMYHLAGSIESVKWTKKEKSLETVFISQDKTMVGDVELKEFNSFDVGANIGVLTTSQLLKQIDFLDDEIEIKTMSIEHDDEIKHIKFIINDKNDSTDYVLADLAVIMTPKSKGIKVVPEYQLEIELDDHCISKFLKAKTVLPETKTATIKQDKNGVYHIILGYSSINTNLARVKINIKENINMDRIISFDSDYLKNIFSAIRGMNNRTMKVSQDGLCHISAENDKLVANYYLVETETNV